MNDNSTNEFEKLLNSIKTPEPPPAPNIKLIAAEWAKQNGEETEINKTVTKRKTKNKKIPTDIHGQEWYKLPNGKWKPITITKTKAHFFDDMEYINGKWRPPDASTCLSTINHIKSTSNVTPTMHNIKLENKSVSVQNDTGANICATGSKEALQSFTDTSPREITSINKDERVQATITGYGFIPLTSTEGKTLNVKVYYSPNIEDIILSPQAIASQFETQINGWYQYANIDNNNGRLGFSTRMGNNIEFELTCNNNLWYHKLENASVTNSKGSVVNKLTDAQNYQLWHSRMGHPGRQAMSQLHQHVKGISPLKGNTFWRCPSCMPMKIAIKKPITTTSKRKPTPSSNCTATISEEIELQDTLHMPDALPGQHFHMDFGFVRGKEFSSRDKEGKIMTSIDGYKSYLLIVDRKSRYAWVFLTSSKHPPIKEAEAVLRKFGSKHKHKTVCTDQGKELGLSHEFKAMLARNHFTLKVTGSDNSRENGRAERPHRTLAQMMRCILHSAELGPEYWSFALTHATKLYNRLPHTSVKMTPIEAFTGMKPDVSNIRIFGSKVYAKKAGNRPFKLDNHAYEGIYLGSTSNEKNVYIRDTHSKKIKIGTHVYFDEAHFSTPTMKAPLAAQALQRLGYQQKEEWMKEYKESIDDNNIAMIQLLSKDSKMPKRGTKGAIGYDVVHPGQTMILAPGQTKVFPTDIALTPPPGCYTRIAPRSGMIVKQNITTLAGVIDEDYTGNIGVILHNFGDKPQTIKHHQKIAQIIFENAQTPKFKKVDKLQSTTRNAKGYGSTDIPATVHQVISNLPATTTSNLHLQLDLPYSITLSKDPFDFKTHRVIKLHGTDPTLGLDTYHCPMYKKPRLKQCRKSTPSARLPNWRSELKDAYILRINHTNINSKRDLTKVIKQSRENNEKEVTVYFATNDCQSIHPQLGVPQLYHDQMDILGKHLWDINLLPRSPKWTPVQLQDVIFNNSTRKRLPKHIVKKLKFAIRTATNVKKPKKLTRRWLKQQLDWDDWWKSEHKQLDQYENQKTFSKPQPYPKGANILNLLWTYLVKDNGTKKARCVCNGSPKMGGTVTLGETYAASLDQCASRIFWAVSALKNMTVIGADASNAFAEAPPPVAPLYVTIDKPFREWWEHKGRPPIPPDYVLKVQGALQGHPESPRLWALLIDNIIQQLDLQPCRHEPCLYTTNNYKGTGKSILLLRQVDDFAVACQDTTIAQQVINDINTKMTISVKELGTLTRFNGVDVEQTKQYIKIYNKTYIQKLVDSHKWLQQHTTSNTHPIPMSADATFRKQLETATPATPEELKALEKEYGFKYRQGVGEILYAMVTCRPDVSFSVVKLSQYSVTPARIHFEAIKQIYIYLKHTINDGIYYWRNQPQNNLPEGSAPNTIKENNYTHTVQEKSQPEGNILQSAVDSDHATDSTHRRSVSGIIHKLAGGAIHYKTKYQDIVATSTSEAEFIAAAEAGKQILYIRSILDTINVPQEAATTLYEDNQGALLMANAQKPTKRTKHMDTRHFALQDWVNRDLITLRRINTSDNYSDAMTKPLQRSLFYRHLNFIQGKIIPEYSYAYKHWKQQHQRQDIAISPTIKMISFQSYSDIHNVHHLRSEQGRKLCRI